MSGSRRFAVIIPACNEEACLAPVLAELRAQLDPEQFPVVIGVNGSTDRTAQIAHEQGAHVAEVAARGYGFGCQAAIELVEAELGRVDGYLFLAADGANDPRDVPALAAEFERGARLVLGCRTTRPQNWSPVTFPHVIANLALGFFCGCLTGRFFRDLGPLRLIERDLFHALELREWTFGWTIEAQIRAALLGARIVEIPVRERPRLAGEQKISHVSWRRTVRIGAHIIAAGWRTWRRTRHELSARSRRPGPMSLIH